MPIETHWHMQPNQAKALMLAKRQLEFNTLMLDFYATNNQQPMNAFMRDCLDKRVIDIMKEDETQN